MKNASSSVVISCQSLLTCSKMSVPLSFSRQDPVRGAARIRSTSSPGSFMISCDQTSTAASASQRSLISCASMV